MAAEAAAAAEAEAEADRVARRQRLLRRRAREPDAEYAQQKDESLAVRVAGHDPVRVPSMIAYEKSVTLV